MSRRSRAVTAAGAMSLILGAGVSGVAHAATPLPSPTALTGTSDERAYERVSPSDKGRYRAEGTLVTADGSAAAFSSFGSFAGQPAAVNQSAYRSRRGAAGWSTEPVTVPTAGPPPPIPVSAPVRWTADLSEQIVSTPAPLTPGAPDYTFDGPYQPLFYENANLYRRSDAGSFTLLSGTEAQIPEPDRATYHAWTMGASRDLKKVIFKANAGLAGAPSAADAPGGSLFFTTDGSDIENVGVLPDGTAAGTDAWLAGNSRFDKLSVSSSTAVSDDASRVFFQTEAGTPGAPQLYLREKPGTDDARTVLVSRSDRTVPEAPGSVTFLAASRDGGKVLFASTAPLTDESGTGDPAFQERGDIYLYDVASGDLTDLTPGKPGTRAIFGAADDLTKAYVASTSALAPGGTDGDFGLYLWSGSGFRFVANLQGQGQELEGEDARTTPDGSVLAFPSTQRLTEYDNTDPSTGTARKMLYIYDAGADTIACASCRPDGAPPTASVFTSFGQPVLRANKPRTLSADGRQLVFQTTDALTPGAATSEAKIYVYNRVRGTVGLISSGSSDDDDRFVDASADGSSVFFTSGQRLTADDTDDLEDVYVSRVGGGFPKPATPEKPCSGDTCQGPRADTASVPNAGSTAGGSGNTQPAPENRSRGNAASVRIIKPKATTGARVGIRVRVSGRGTLSASGSGLRRAKRVTTRSTTYTLKARLSARAERELRRRGQLTLKARVVFTARGGKSVSKTVTLKFVREAARTRTATSNIHLERTAG